MIELIHVTKRFGQITALDDLSLVVNPGEVFVLLGPNGAGKTTAFKLIVGLLKPNSGIIRLCGYDVQKQPLQARAQVAYVPDMPFLYEKLTPWEFIRFTGKLYGLSDEELMENARPLIERFRLTPHLHSYIETLSHGMRQRVAITAALSHRPRVFVIDEPMVGLDPYHMRVAKDLFRECAKIHGMTVLVSTHQLDIAEEIADRVGIIHMGKLIAIGTPEQLRQQVGKSGPLEQVFLALTTDNSSTQATKK